MKFLAYSLILSSIITLAGCSSSEETNQKDNIAYNAEQRFDVAQYRHNPNTDSEDQNGLWLALGKHTTEEGKQYFLRTLVKVDDTKTPVMQSCGYHLPYELYQRHVLKNLSENKGNLENPDFFTSALSHTFISNDYKGITPHFNQFEITDSETGSKWNFVLGNPIFQTILPELSSDKTTIFFYKGIINQLIESLTKADGQASKEVMLTTSEYSVNMIKLHDQIPESIGNIDERRVDCFTEFMTIEGEEAHYAIELQETGKRFVWLQDNLESNNITMTDTYYVNADKWDLRTQTIPQGLGTLVFRSNHPYYKENRLTPEFLKPFIAIDQVNIDYSIPDLFATKANIRLYNIDIYADENSENNEEDKSTKPLVLSSEFSFEINLSSFENTDDKSLTP